MEQIIEGDCFVVLSTLSHGSIDAVVTSPPYAEQRVEQYGGVSEADYPSWTVRWLEALRPALKPEASVGIVIRAHVENGVVSDYVLRTRLAVRDAGWFEPEELIWMKPDAPPLGHVGRPRRAWENILWFSPTRNPYCDPKSNGKASARLGLASSRKGFGSWLHQDVAQHAKGVARCRDVAMVPVSAANRDDFNTHPAQYPEDLAIWMIRLLSPLGGMVLDPFVGSGTTAVAAKRLGRDVIGVELKQDYAEIARRRLANVESGDLLEWNSPLSFFDGMITLPPHR